MGIFGLKASERRIESALSFLDRVYAPYCADIQDVKCGNHYREDPFVGGIARQGHEVIADVSSAARITALTSDPKYAGASSAVGFSSCWNVFQGVLGFLAAKKACEVADSKNDQVGLGMSFLDAMLRVCQFVGGMSFIQIRFSGVMDGFSALKDVSFPVKECAMAVSACFSGVFISLSILSILALSENIYFVRKNTTAVAEGQESLLEKRIGMLTGKTLADLAKPLTKKQLYVHTGEHLRAMLYEIDASLADGVSDYRLGRALFTTEKGRARLPTVLERMGYMEGVTGNSKDALITELQTKPKLQESILHAEKRVAYRRIVGGKGAELIEKAREMDLHGLLKSDDAKIKAYAQGVAKDLIEKLRLSAKEQRPMMWAYLTCGLFGAFILMINYTVVLPMHAIIEAASFAICFVTMGYGDYCCFRGAIASDGPVGKGSLRYTYAHLALGIVAVTTAVALTVLSSGTFPIILVTLVGTVWICMDLYIVYTLRRKAKEYEENHPTLQRFAMQLQKAIDANKANKANEEKDKTTVQANEKVRLLTEACAEKRKLIQMFLKLPQLQRRALLSSLCKEVGNKKIIDSLKKEMNKIREWVISNVALNDADSKLKSIVQDIFQESSGLLLGEEQIPGKIEDWRGHLCKKMFTDFFEEKLIERYERIFLESIDLQDLQKACTFLQAPFQARSATGK